MGEALTPPSPDLWQLVYILRISNRQTAVKGYTKNTSLESRHLSAISKFKSAQIFICERNLRVHDKWLVNDIYHNRHKYHPKSLSLLAAGHDQQQPIRLPKHHLEQY